MARWGTAFDSLFEDEIKRGDPNYEDPEDDYVYRGANDDEDDFEAFAASGGGGSLAPPPAAGRTTSGSSSGGGRQRHVGVSAYKRAVKVAIEEFDGSHDRAELARCVTDPPGSAMFRAEVPRVVLLSVAAKACATDDEACGAAVTRAALVLKNLSTCGALLRHQIERGIVQIFDRLEGDAIDAPQLKRIAPDLAKRAAAAELVSDRFAAALAEMRRIQFEDAEARAANKAKAADAAGELFSSGDVAEFSIACSELPELVRHEAVKALISLAMDRGDRERELASFALATVSGDTVPQNEAERGAEVLVQRASGLAKDVPDAVRLLSRFVARAMADEALPPAFLARVQLLGSKHGLDVVRGAEALLRDGSASRRWGEGSSVAELKQSVRALVAEYFDTGDAAEAERAWRDLNSPHFAHEAVLRLVSMAVDRAERESTLVVDLLRRLIKSGTIGEAQARLGFERLNTRLSELSLDAPKAPATVAAIREKVF